MTAWSLLTRGPFPAEPPEAPQQTVPVGKRTAPEVQEKVAPSEGRYKANLAVPAPRHGGPGPEGGGRVRYDVGVDWADQTHAVWVVNESGTKTAAARCHTRQRA